MSNIIKGFKVFEPDWTCRGFQYEVGKEYFHDGNIGLCHAGFHFCQVASDCFCYYPFNPENKVAEVEAIGLTKTEDNRSVTNHIRIVREIPWQELLTIVNTGKGCTGLCNTGNRNTGGWNAGDCNTGDCNPGNRNTGGCNTGDCNTGNRNTGDRNTGNRNTGNRNTGNRNTGDRNTGNRNTGDWNTGDRNTGFFNTDEPFVRSFNKPTKMHTDDFRNLPGVKVLFWNYENSWWIYSDNMTDDEKAAHPEHEMTGGYLKTIPFKDACVMMWERLSDREKKDVRAIPNFNAKLFKEITGIEANL